jgi:ribosomal protein S18 acetylase RimI-like enzyme
MEQDAGAAAARAWHHSSHESVCDLVEPWEHGTVVRASRYPDYHDYNVVRVERDPQMSAAELADLADLRLDGLEHRRIDFETAEPAYALRRDFEALGWTSTALVWMRHDGPPPPAALQVTEVGYDAVRDLRVAWHAEDFPGVDADDYLKQSRDVALRRDVRVFAAPDGSRPLAFSQLESAGDAAEIRLVYVAASERGRGMGTAITRASIRAAYGARDLFIVADDEDRAKHLYARLGFVPVWRTVEFRRVP